MTGAPCIVYKYADVELMAAGEPTQAEQASRMTPKIVRQPQMDTHKHATPRGLVMIFTIRKITAEGQLAAMPAKIRQHTPASGMGRDAFHARAGTVRMVVMMVAEISLVEAAQMVEQ